VLAGSILLPQERLISHEAFDLGEQFWQDIRSVFVGVHASHIEHRPGDAVPRDCSVTVQVAVRSPLLAFRWTRIAGKQPQTVVVMIEAMVGPDDGCI